MSIDTAARFFEIEAYCDVTSVALGEKITIHARRKSTAATGSTCPVQFFRCPRSPKARQLTNPSTVIKEDSMTVKFQPNGDAQSGCHWPGKTFTISDDWSSGLYMVRVGVDQVSADAYFVVRPRQPSPGNVLIQIPFTTVHAYDAWGGGCFYGAPNLPPVPSVFFLRPVTFEWAIDDIHGPLRPFLKWFDRNVELGEIPNADYISSIDLADGNYPIKPNKYKLMITVGHDEYWSNRMVDNVLNFVWEGGNLACLGANICDGRVAFAADFKTMMYAQGDRWRNPNNEHKDILLVGMNTPTDLPGSLTQTIRGVPYALNQAGHWALQNVNDSMFGVTDIRNSAI